ncbi:MAG: ATPase [Roseburia sp.]
MLTEHHRLEEQINSIHSELQALPNGKLIFSKNGSQYKWYQSDGHSKTYISKENRPLAEQLAKKKYLMRLSNNLLHEKRAIEFYLKHHNSDVKSEDQLLLNMPEYETLLAPYFSPLSEELNLWMNAPFEQNEKYPENRIHKTISGQYVRSKSESMIAILLSANHIPYRYECALYFDDTKLFPDFTIRHPKTGQFFYWEHFGLMDQPNYRKSASSKLQLYISNGIIPTLQLITTYETAASPLSTELVENVIKHYFL